MVSIIANEATGAAFVNPGQVLGGGCNWRIAECSIDHHSIFSLFFP
jgi:hypothetical protein